MSVKKVYKIFISSVYDDLITVRSAIIKGIMDEGHLPVCMEHNMDATSDSRRTVLEEEIEACDFVVLVVCGKYGTEYKGKSFTEMEYDIASGLKKQVIAILPKDLSALPEKYQETDSVKQKKVEDFIKRIRDDDGTPAVWSKSSEISGKALAGIRKTIGQYNASHKKYILRKSTEYLCSFGDLLGSNFADIIKDSQKISILGRATSIVVESKAADLLNELKKGCRLDFVVLNPGSDVVNNVFGKEKEKFNEQYLEMLTNLANIKRGVSEEYQNNLKLGITNLLPRSSLIIIEKKKAKEHESFALILLDVRERKPRERPIVCVGPNDTLHDALETEFAAYSKHSATTDII